MRFEELFSKTPYPVITASVIGWGETSSLTTVELGRNYYIAVLLVDLTCCTSSGHLVWLQKFRLRFTNEFNSVLGSK